MSKTTDLIERQIVELTTIGREEKTRRSKDNNHLQSLRLQAKSVEERIASSLERAEKRLKTIAELEQDLSLLRAEKRLKTIAELERDLSLLRSETPSLSLIANVHRNGVRVWTY